MINRVVLVGRMTKDPELRTTSNGSSVTNFTLALNRNFSSADGQTADYINCVVWNKQAQNVSQYCAKGSLVGVDGQLRSRSYDNAQGQRVYVVEVLCNSVEFLETKATRQQQQQQSQYNAQQQPQQQANQDDYYDMKTVDLEKDFDNSFSSFDIMEDDIQF